MTIDRKHLVFIKILIWNSFRGTPPRFIAPWPLIESIWCSLKFLYGSRQGEHPPMLIAHFMICIMVDEREVTFLRNLLLSLEFMYVDALDKNLSLLLQNIKGVVDSTLLMKSIRDTYPHSFMSVCPSIQIGFRAFPGERKEGSACYLAWWCILTTFRTD